MSGVKQLQFEAELGVQVDRLEARFKKLGQFGLTIWTGMLRGVLHDLIVERAGRENRAYQEVMLLESVAREVECEATREAILARCARIKGVLSVLCLGLVLGGLVDSDVFLRSASRIRSARLVRVFRGKGLV